MPSQVEALYKEARNCVAASCYTASLRITGLDNTKSRTDLCCSSAYRSTTLRLLLCYSTIRWDEPSPRSHERAGERADEEALGEP